MSGTLNKLEDLKKLLNMLSEEQLQDPIYVDDPLNKPYNRKIEYGYVASILDGDRAPIGSLILVLK